MAGMPMPDWVDDVKKKMVQMVQDAPDQASYGVRKLKPIIHFSNLFAEYDIRENDILLHLFPRRGADDQWSEGHYINRCKSCHREVGAPRGATMKPCPSCGHCGLVYIPGRQEEKASVIFPSNMRDIIKEAIDNAWMGDVAIDLIPELGAYSIQLQNAKTAAKVVGVEKFIDRVCEEIDERLDE